MYTLLRGIDILILNEQISCPIAAPSSPVDMASASTTGSSDGLYPHGLVALPQGVPMTTILKRLGGGSDSDPAKHVSVRPLTEPSAFVNPKTVMYTMDGCSRRWDMVESHPSVAILLYHVHHKAFLLVRQFRPPVYANLLRHAMESPVLYEAAFTFELCAGIVDKPGLSLLDIAREEVQEETGYLVPTGGMFKVTSFLSAVGISGSRQTIFAADVDDSMLNMTGDGQLGGGLAEHGEAIEVVALPIDNVNAFLLDDSLGKSAGLMFALQWGRDRLLDNGGLCP
jgi:nudix-type nucleoside diphosphatase (YffH/AdpP family)